MLSLPPMNPNLLLLICSIGKRQAAPSIWSEPPKFSRLAATTWSTVTSFILKLDKSCFILIPRVSFGAFGRQMLVQRWIFRSCYFNLRRPAVQRALQESNCQFRGDTVWTRWQFADLCVEKRPISTHSKRRKGRRSDLELLR